MYLEIDLARIRANPRNPRKIFSGQRFDELKSSIAAKGVIEPILVRRIFVDKGDIDYEIVAGERRWRAAKQLAESNGGSGTIPAIIRDMTDDEAFDVMMVENLQREDLTELEEAESFKEYLDKRGKNAIPELAERLGIHQRYIQRRVAVLGLPKSVLKAWGEGKVKYGHCEQLMRLKDPGIIKEYLNDLTNNNHGSFWTVERLSSRIDQDAIELSWAKFDRKKECAECRYNSDIQRDIFGDEYGRDKTRCIDAACFRKKQGAWFDRNWGKFSKNAGTNGFRFRDLLDWSNFHEFDKWTGKPGEKCSECPDFISIVSIRGKMEHEQACIGAKSCFQETVNKASIRKQDVNGGDHKAGDKDGPRVAWHGAYFREKFYHDRIAAELGNRDCDSIFNLRAALFAVLKSNDEARIQFAVDQKIIRDDQRDFCIGARRVWDKITQMERFDVFEAIKYAAIRIVLQSNHFSSMLDSISDHLGISLAREWRIDREYLDKKTIGEIHELGEKLGIYADVKVQTYLYETLGKKRGKFTSCRKEELIRLILESGVDLSGKVPKEILDIKTRDNDDIYDDVETYGEDMVCRVCGCTEFSPCLDENGEPCHWAEDDLCSACAGTENDARREATA